MTDPRPLLEIDASAPLLLFEADAKAGAEAAWGWREAGLTVRVARGRKMRTVDRLFDEMAAALQFPYYFGENWAAFDECFADMGWLPMNAGIVVVILDPAEVLTAENNVELAILVRAITHAAQTYAEPIELGEWWDRPAVPFHVVLQAGPADAASVRARWETAGVEVSALSGPSGL
jgi:hypothetical protein